MYIGYHSKKKEKKAGMSTLAQSISPAHIPYAGNKLAEERYFLQQPERSAV